MQESFSTVGIVGRSEQRGISDVLGQLLPLLAARDLEVLLEDNLQTLVNGHGCRIATRDEIGDAADLVIVVGGDGSLLSAARTLAKYDTPVLGVNRGRLGFLTDITTDEIEQQVPAVLAGEYVAEQRFLLDATLRRDGQVVGRADALNDVVVNSGTSAQMIELELTIDDAFVYRQRADGLIVSTPTGSTAYSLSCGGPIIHPDSNAIVLNPIAPHNLYDRPVVIPLEGTLEIEAEGRDDHLMLTMDTRSYKVAAPAKFAVRPAERPFLLVQLPGVDFIETVRRKLHLGLDAREGHSMDGGQETGGNLR